VSQSFDRDACVYRLVFDADARLEAASEISIPAGVYAEGWTAEVEPPTEYERTTTASPSGRHQRAGIRSPFAPLEARRTRLG
jgi:hypothetical protein